MFTRAYLQELGNGQLRSEERLLRTEFERRGIPVTLYHAKRIQRRQLRLSPTDFLGGDVDCVRGALQMLGIEPPLPNDYPECLRAFLHRRVWCATLGRVEQSIVAEGGEPIFVKPAEAVKRFTGRPVSSMDDLREIGGVSRRSAVWCAKLVTWRVEYRAYVIGCEIVSLDRYAGDAAIRVDQDVVEAAIAKYRATGQAPAAYGIDFGVLENGETALVEVNDGFSLGAYQIGAEAYTNVLAARWKELTLAAEPPG